MNKNEKIRFAFRLPKDLFNKIKKQAQNQGYSINAFILHILWDWDKEQK